MSNRQVMYLNGRTQLKLSAENIESNNLKLIIRPGAYVTIVDDRAYDAGKLSITLEIIAQSNAHIQYKDQRSFVSEAEIESCILLESLQDSQIYFEQWQRGAEKIHSKLYATLAGKNSEIQIRFGAQYSGATTHEIETVQLHKASHTKSNCVVRTALYDKSRALYNGMIIVEKNAEGSEAFQQHKSLLMSDKAYSFARPSIEVLTDDVQCGHGSAIGQLDAEHLLYLEARGIDSSAARMLLLDAFFADLNIVQTK